MKYQAHLRTLSTFPILLFVLAVSQFGNCAIAQEAESKFELPATEEGLPGAGPIRRMENFVKAWKTKRTAWSKRIAEDQNSLVFLGDSITQGWGDDFKGNFPG